MINDKWLMTNGKLLLFRARVAGVYAGLLLLFLLFGVVFWGAEFGEGDEDVGAEALDVELVLIDVLKVGVLLADEIFQTFDTSVGQRMGGHPLWPPTSAPGLFGFCFEDFHDLDLRNGVVAEFGHVTKCKQVGFGLLISAELEQVERSSDGCAGPQDLHPFRVVVLACDTDGDAQALDEHGLGHLLADVLGGDVADFVAEHACELGFVGHLGEQASGHEDFAAG